MPESTEIVQTQPKSDGDLHFKLPVFEGPLDLLLHLIKENKIDIYDIPIAIITKQYLGYLDLMKELNLEIAGEFLVMAATLIQIKSKMLLPPDEEEVEEQAEDPRAELVQRLLEYKSFKETSSEFREKETIWRNIFNRMPPQVEEIEIGPELSLSEVSLFDLLSAFKDILSKAPEQVIEITREKLTVADKINYIMDKLESDEGLKFEDIFQEGFTRLTLIVTFLALLELIRLGLVKAYQERAFGSIWIINPQKMPEEQKPEIPSPDLFSDAE
jgi:segregation and condensation protein A